MLELDDGSEWRSVSCASEGRAQAAGAGSESCALCSHLALPQPFSYASDLPLLALQDLSRVQSSKGSDLSQGALMASLSLPLAPPPPAWQDQLHDSLVKRNAAESAYATIINECECSGSLSDAT